jgi:DNA-binding transcriptional regulator GbsR (MarR family)
MNLNEAKSHFIAQWGNMAGVWGVNRTMGQIHACLLIAEDDLSAETLMALLNISRGNANMSIRSLIDWGLAERVHKIGERREYFRADKDPHSMMLKITQQRRKRELEPLIKLFSELENIETHNTVEKEEVLRLNQVFENLNSFTKKNDKLLRRFLKSEEEWYINLLSKILK